MLTFDKQENSISMKIAVNNSFSPHPNTAHGAANCVRNQDVYQQLETSKSQFSQTEQWYESVVPVAVDNHKGH